MKNKLLTKREQQIFNLLVLNKSTKEIASQLGISEKTVRNHISNVIQKLGVLNKAKAMLMEKNHYSEEEAHRYIQKCSMDSGTNLIETAQMVLTMLESC